MRQANSDMVALYKEVPNSVGTAGTGFFASNSQGLATLDKRLNELLIPTDQRDIVLTLKDTEAFKKLSALTKVNEAGDASLRRDFRIPKVSGFNFFHDQQMPTHTTGTITGEPTVGSAAAIGATEITISCDSDDAVALKAGDIIEFSEETTFTYVVAEDVTIANSASDTVTIKHGLRSALTTASEMSLVTGHGTSVVNLAGQFKGFTVVNRMPARDVFGGVPLGDAMPMIEPQTGLGVMLIAYPGYHQVIWEVVGLYGMSLVDERRLVRIQSYAS